MNSLFKKLNEEQILYAVWKDTQAVTSFFDGNKELDILVHENCRYSFEKIIGEYGFIHLKVRAMLAKENIEHYITYKNGKYFHLHVYYQLITGNHFVKEYKFHINTDIFNRSIKVNQVKTIGSEDEMALVLLRLSLKQSLFFTSIKASELQRASRLAKTINAKHVALKLQYYSDIESKSIVAIIEDIANKSNVDKSLIKLKKEFKFYRTKGVASFYKTLLLMKCYLMLLRIGRSSNKTLPNKGITIAIMGTDGSGKSTIVNKISTIFKAKTSTRVIYLGGNNKTYSLVTRLCFLIYKALSIFSPFKEKHYFAWVLYSLGIGILEYAKANDREVKVRQGNKLKNKGWIVIFERFPMVGLFDFPNKLYQDDKTQWFSRAGGKLVKHLLSKLESKVLNVEQPDISFLLTVEFETMLKRRQMADNEVTDIKNKLHVQSNYLKTNNQLHVLDNNIGLEATITKITEKVNVQLCT